MDIFNISIDPSIRKTGICIWKNGAPIELKTLYPPKGTETERILWLKRRLAEICVKLKKEGDINRIAVEAFGGHTKNPMLKMMKCSQARGALVCEAQDWCLEVIDANKGNAPKAHAAWLAQSFGLEGSEDAKDALHLGVIAGFDKK